MCMFKSVRSASNFYFTLFIFIYLFIFLKMNVNHMFSLTQRLCHTSCRETSNSGDSTSTDSQFCFASHTGSLTALVCQHSITPLALPCKLIIPDRGKAAIHTLLGDSRHYGGSGELTSPSVCNYLKETAVGLPHLRKSPYFCPQIPSKMRRSRPRSRSPTLLPSC